MIRLIRENDISVDHSVLRGSRVATRLPFSEYKKKAAGLSETLISVFGNSIDRVIDWLIDRQTDGRTDGWMDGWMGGWVGR